ncbi:aldo/keto reductase [Streptomyces sp. GESEQ-35]|uniref:aldo/keto reductase n=1 Tax=Streptomyces sp. GESEQ-35 TaxID=2812657 RepID=UPI0027E30CC8|nr:aldo/keto reductase [Streptomyces sp. GESEQ-35]
MQIRPIGPFDVSAVGLGAMPLSIEGRPDAERAIATVHAALDAGMALIDTADAYHVGADDIGHNETLVAKALSTYGPVPDVLVATKGGSRRSGDGSLTVDGRPEYIKRACEQSLARLGVEAIGLYQFHRPDPRIPYAESVGALAELLEEGKIVAAGVSNVDPEQIRTAREVLGGRLASVQNQFSPTFRSSRPELDLCHELGIAFLPWRPLGGISRARRLGARHLPFTYVAQRLDATPQQVCLAWMLALSPVVIPIPGSSRPETARDSAAAAELHIPADALALLDASPLVTV